MRKAVAEVSRWQWLASRSTDLLSDEGQRRVAEETIADTEVAPAVRASRPPSHAAARAANAPHAPQTHVRQRTHTDTRTPLAGRDRLFRTPC